MASNPKKSAAPDETASQAGPTSGATAKKLKDMTPAERKAYNQAKAQERKDKQEAARKERLAQLAKQEAEFAATRELHWLRLWSNALRIELLFKGSSEWANHPFREANTWWFEDFRVDAEKCEFTVCSFGLVNQEALTAQNVEQIENALNEIYGLYQEYLDEEERKRQAALELARKRKEALDKLTEEDRKVLGLSSISGLSG